MNNTDSDCSAQSAQPSEWVHEKCKLKDSTQGEGDGTPVSAPSWTTEVISEGLASDC